MYELCKLEEELAREKLFIRDLQQRQGRARGLHLQTAIGKPCSLSIAPGYSSLAPRLWFISPGQRLLFLSQSAQLKATHPSSSFSPSLTSHILTFPLCYFLIS